MNKYIEKLISKYVYNHNIYMSEQNSNLTFGNLQDMELEIVMLLLRDMGYKYVDGLYIKQ